ncbi:hypothetical protein OG930_33035 [Streptomyces sp. NBC_01799]|nr:hypothetical protein [Streptomyces sp. NBC_01800]WSA71516.1 hypothetical protein OIE65_33640 [Streptomyces sp. NBC_01800]WSA80028.1 hypothetical protein OG930_33035 [Streptomyces sp. NBC_01799]
MADRPAEPGREVGLAERTAEGVFLVRATVPVHRPGGAGNQGRHETEAT